MPAAIFGNATADANGVASYAVNVPARTTTQQLNAKVFMGVHALTKHLLGVTL